MNTLQRITFGIPLALWFTLHQPKAAIGGGMEPPVSNPASENSLRVGAEAESPAERLRKYRSELDLLRHQHQGLRELPEVRFFLFGMGPRRKMIYLNGQLKDSRSGETIRRWEVAEEIIVPSDYAVFIKTRAGKTVKVLEDESGVWVEEGNSRTALSSSQIRLPSFQGHLFASILRVLHQEVLVNIINGEPLPNYFVYSKPWYRDGAIMGMVLRETGNLDLIKSWVMGLSEPFDRNNGGETEADNLGQALYLVSLVSDPTHPLVKKILKTFPQFRKGHSLNGRSDFSYHPVYQTKWAKFGLRSLGLKDPFRIPRLKDSYSSLLWWDFRDEHIPGERFDRNAARDYPYLVWAEDHFYGEKRGLVGNCDYPLSWECRASQANYTGMSLLSPIYAEQKLSVPHAWHAAEMFLLLLREGVQ